MAELIDGKQIAADIRAEVAQAVKQLAAQSVKPGLAVVLAGEDPASAVYVRMKAKACEEVGIHSRVILLPVETNQAEVEKVIDELNADPAIHGILVQLPLPPQIAERSIIWRIDPAKDVDAFHPVNVGRLAVGDSDAFRPATPAGVIELLLRSGHDPSGKLAAVVGRSNIVGRPLATLLSLNAKGGNATVTVCHSRTPNLFGITRQADIVVAAIGRPEFITKEAVQPGAVVIDVGVNRVDDAGSEDGYRLVGDVAFDEVAEIAGAITPVPGGVGPMTIAMLLSNCVKAARSIASTA